MKRLTAILGAAAVTVASLTLGTPVVAQQPLHAKVWTYSVPVVNRTSATFLVDFNSPKYACSRRFPVSRSETRTYECTGSGETAPLHVLIDNGERKCTAEITIGTFTYGVLIGEIVSHHATNLTCTIRAGAHPEIKLTP